MELRKDYILDRYVIISEGRGSRPKEFKEEEKVKESKNCYFCPGNEKTTPPEIMRIDLPNEKGWQIRVFPNKFPAADKKGDPVINGNFLTGGSAYGTHEIVVETPDHDKQLRDLSEGEIKDVLKVYGMRIEKLSADKNIKYVTVFKNHGKKGGTSIYHTHSQIIGYNIMPELVKKEVEACQKEENCPFCEVIKKERETERLCFEDEHVVAFCPYASRFNYEVWLFPKRHVEGINDFKEEEFDSVAGMLKKVLVKLGKLGADYNFFPHYSEEKDFHFHIEVCPRIATWGGFELSTDTIINSVAPEEAAKFYRE